MFTAAGRSGANGKADQEAILSDQSIATCDNHEAVTVIVISDD